MKFFYMVLKQFPQNFSLPNVILLTTWSQVLESLRRFAHHTVDISRATLWILILPESNTSLRSQQTLSLWRLQMSSRHVLEKFIVDNLYFICNLNLLYPKQKFTWLHKYLENYDQMAAFKIFAEELCNGFLNNYHYSSSCWKYRVVHIIY